MLEGSPAPLHAAVPLFPLSRRLPAGQVSGAWLRGRRAPAELRLRGRGLLVAADLAWLLRRAGRIAVLDRGRVVVADGDELIAWRTLQVVLGAPFLPPLPRLHGLFPDLRVRGSRLAVPLGHAAPEEALAACVAERVRVVASWIDYRR